MIPLFALVAGLGLADASAEQRASHSSVLPSPSVASSTKAVKNLGTIVVTDTPKFIDDILPDNWEGFVQFYSISCVPCIREMKQYGVWDRTKTGFPVLNIAMDGLLVGSERLQSRLAQAFPGKSFHTFIEGMPHFSDPFCWRYGLGDGIHYTPQVFFVKDGKAIPIEYKDINTSVLPTPKASAPAYRPYDGPRNYTSEDIAIFLKSIPPKKVTPQNYQTVLGDVWDKTTDFWSRATDADWRIIRTVFLDEKNLRMFAGKAGLNDAVADTIYQATLWKLTDKACREHSDGWGYAKLYENLATEFVYSREDALRNVGRTHELNNIGLGLGFPTINPCSSSRYK